MLFDLSRMRREGISDKLIERKKTLENKGLMDQLVFNHVAYENGGITSLAPRYNLMPIYLWQKMGRKFFTMAELNKMAGTSYSDIPAMTADAAILHFPGHDKPWAKLDNPYSGIWYSYFNQIGLSDKKLSAFNKHKFREIKSATFSDEPVATVVIPVYNTSQYLQECLESVRQQTLKNIEIICIDDASNDNSLSLLETAAAKDSRIKVFTLQTNAGLSFVRNVGLSAARGRYVYFLDSDDVLIDTALEWLCSFADHYELDEVFFAMRDFEDCEEGGKRRFLSDKASLTHEYQIGMSGLDMLRFLRRDREWRPCVPVRLIRRSLLNSIGLRFYDGIVHEDNLFSFLLDFQVKKCACVPRMFLLRRVRAYSITQSVASVKNIVGYNIVVNEIRAFLKTHAVPRSFELALSDWIGWMIRQMVNIYFTLSEEQQGTFTFHGSQDDRIWWQSIWSVFLFERRKCKQNVNSFSSCSVLSKQQSQKNNVCKKVPFIKKLRRVFKSFVPFIVLQKNVRNRCNLDIENPAKSCVFKIILSIVPSFFAFCLICRKYDDKRMVKFWIPYGIMKLYLSKKYGVSFERHNFVGSSFRACLPYGYILWWDKSNDELRGK
jgi:glycosyltransferase involved in cell wall biosynthesis